MDAIMVFIGIGFILTGIVLQLAGMKEAKPVEEKTEPSTAIALAQNLRLRGAVLAAFGFAVNIVYFMFLN